MSLTAVFIGDCGTVPLAKISTCPRHTSTVLQTHSGCQQWHRYQLLRVPGRETGCETVPEQRKRGREGTWLLSSVPGRANIESKASRPRLVSSLYLFRRASAFIEAGPDSRPAAPRFRRSRRTARGERHTVVASRETLRRRDGQRRLQAGQAPRGASLGADDEGRNVRRAEAHGPQGAA